MKTLLILYIMYGPLGHQQELAADLYFLHSDKGVASSIEACEKFKKQILLNEYAWLEVPIMLGQARLVCEVGA